MAYKATVVSVCLRFVSEATTASHALTSLHSTISTLFTLHLSPFPFNAHPFSRSVAFIYFLLA